VLYTGSASLAYPNMIVGSWKLAAGHDGLCEMFVADREPELGRMEPHGISWEPDPADRGMQVRYRWQTAPAACSVASPHRWHCCRAAGHPGGHSFTALGVED
jgi:hypothetical protein